MLSTSRCISSALSPSHFDRYRQASSPHGPLNLVARRPNSPQTVLCRPIPFHHVSSCPITPHHLPSILTIFDFIAMHPQRFVNSSPVRRSPSHPNPPLVITLHPPKFASHTRLVHPHSLLALATFRSTARRASATRSVHPLFSSQSTSVKSPPLTRAFSMLKRRRSAFVIFVSRPSALHSS